MTNLGLQFLVATFIPSQCVWFFLIRLAFWFGLNVLSHIGNVRILRDKLFLGLWREKDKSLKLLVEQVGAESDSSEGFYFGSKNTRISWQSFFF